jgi:hypothetical protein
VQRLHLAIGGRRRIGCEAQILEAGAALDEPKLAVPEAVAFAEYRMNLVEGEPQRRVPRWSGGDRPSRRRQGPLRRKR